MAETKLTPDELALKLKELRDMHKLSVITDEEFEKRSYFLLHPDAAPQDIEKVDVAAQNEALAMQLKELRDLHKLSIITDMEFERRTYKLLHPEKK
jgi:hypothetical protein